MIGDPQHNALLSNYQPKGASAVTAQGDRLTVIGVAASRQLAQADSQRVSEIADRFVQACASSILPPALLAGIASRESRCGAVLDANGWGDGEHAFGILQIDKRSFQIVGQDDPKGVAHIQQAVGILHDNLAQVQHNHPDWPLARQLQGAVAAYNVGVRNVQTLDGMDIGTTHDDYS